MHYVQSFDKQVDICRHEKDDSECMQTLLSACIEQEEQKSDRRAHLKAKESAYSVRLVDREPPTGCKQSKGGKELTIAASFTATTP